MTEAVLLDELSTRGIVIRRVGEALRWRGRVRIPADLVERLREHKTALLAVLRRHEAIYAEITADYGTAEDLQAFTWLDAQTDRDVAREIAALERRCEDLAAAGAPENVYREAVEALVAFFDEARRLHQEAHQLRDSGDEHDEVREHRHHERHEHYDEEHDGDDERHAQLDRDRQLLR